MGDCSDSIPLAATRTFLLAAPGLGVFRAGISVRNLRSQVSGFTY